MPRKQAATQDSKVKQGAQTKPKARTLKAYKDLAPNMQNFIIRFWLGSPDLSPEELDTRFDEYRHKARQEREAIEQKVYKDYYENCSSTQRSGLISSRW